MNRTYNKTVNEDILASFPFWVASPLYPKLQSSQNARYSWRYVNMARTWK